MLIKYKKSKLLEEVLEILLISLLVSVFLFYFLYISSLSIAENYFHIRDMSLKPIEYKAFNLWIKSLCFAGSVVSFLSLFLFSLGQKFSYVLYILDGIENLNKNNMDYIIKVEGKNELAQLAEKINYLTLSQRELSKKQQKLKEERENIIRSISHDIRTPLTSIISYSEYIKGKDALQKQDFYSYINLVQTKSEQIKILTDKLLGKEDEPLKIIENGKLLINQLVFEWEELLEDKFNCKIDLSLCGSFKCLFKIEDLRRIFDNIASNIEKYANPNNDILLKIMHREQKLIIIQENTINNNTLNKESFKIGLKSIKEIVDGYNGDINVIKNERTFKIEIYLDTIN